MRREDFINFMFNDEMCIDIHLIPILTIAIQIADMTQFTYSEILGRSCYNIAYKYYYDDSYGMLDYTDKVIELRVLSNISYIPRYNFLTRVMSILSDEQFDRMNNEFIFYMMRKLCVRRLHDYNPFAILLAMKMLYDRNKLTFK